MYLSPKPRTPVAVGLRVVARRGEPTVVLTETRRGVTAAAQDSLIAARGVRVELVRGSPLRPMGVVTSPAWTVEAGRELLREFLAG